MVNSTFYSYAIQLCSSDHVCGFIPAQPVTDLRMNITKKRIACIFSLIISTYNEMLCEFSEGNDDKFFFAFEKAMLLTCADVSCGVIAVEPILYDRDEKIVETLKSYFSMIYTHLEDNNIETTGFINKSFDMWNSSASRNDAKLVLPIPKVMKKRKIKKGKR